MLGQRRPRYRDIIKFEATSRIEMAIFGRWRTGKNFAVLMVCGRKML